MSPEVVGVTGIFILILFLLFGMNIGVAMLIVGFAGYSLITDINSALSMVSTTAFNSIAFYSISVIPMFMFMGSLLNGTRIGEDLFRTAYTWLGGLRGGLAYATVASCTLFAAACGSSFAETMAMGRLAVPEMRKYNYSESLASGCVACAGSLAILMPPSIGFIVYGILTEQPVGTLFVAGIFPAIVLSMLYMLVIYIVSLVKPEIAPKGPKTTLMEKLKALRFTGPFILLFLIIFGGIYFGIFTPTEAGAMGAFGALVLGVIFRRLTLKNFFECLKDAATSTAMMTFVIVGAFVFMKFVAVSQLPLILSQKINELHVSKYVIFALIIVFYVILGMFLDILSAVPLTIPIVYPVVLALGFDPIWFGVVVVILMEMGLATPPVGLNVYLLSGVTGIDLGTIFKGVWPFVGAMLVMIVLLAIFPDIALWLPSVMQ